MGRHAALLLALAAAVCYCGDQCSLEMMDGCTQQIQQLTDQKNFATTKEDLDAVCPNLNVGLLCIQRYTEQCMQPEMKEQFMKLYTAPTRVIQDLCTDGPYQREFLRHAPCMQKAKIDYEECYNQHQKKMNDIKQSGNSSDAHSDNDMNIRIVCCAFQDFRRCSQAAVQSKCGEEAADFAGDIMDRMVSPLISGHCENLPSTGDVCLAMSSGYLSGAERPAASVAVMIAFAAMLASGSSR